MRSRLAQGPYSRTVPSALGTRGGQFLTSEVPLCMFQTHSDLRGVVQGLLKFRTRNAVQGYLTHKK